MKDAQRVLVQLASLQLGIIPVDDPELPVKKALMRMKYEEALKTRRKFRKTWRQAQKLLGKTLYVPGVIKHRRYMVLEMLHRQIDPLIEALPQTT